MASLIGFRTIPYPLHSHKWSEETVWNPLFMAPLELTQQLAPKATSMPVGRKALLSYYPTWSRLINVSLWINRGHTVSHRAIHWPVAEISDHPNRYASKCRLSALVPFDVVMLLSLALRSQQTIGLSPCVCVPCLRSGSHVYKKSVM